MEPVSPDRSEGVGKKGGKGRKKERKGKKGEERKERRKEERKKKKGCTRRAVVKEGLLAERDLGSEGFVVEIPRGSWQLDR